jgi:hypothetical protein
MENTVPAAKALGTLFFIKTPTPVVAQGAGALLLIGSTHSNTQLIVTTRCADSVIDSFA